MAKDAVGIVIIEGMVGIGVEAMVFTVASKVIGHWEGRVFVMTVSATKAMLKCPRSWAIDAIAFDKGIWPQGSYIMVIDTDTNKRYQVEVALFDALKQVRKSGYGKQYFLPLGYWTVLAHNAVQPKLPHL